MPFLVLMCRWCRWVGAAPPSSFLRQLGPKALPGEKGEIRAASSPFVLGFTLAFTGPVVSASSSPMLLWVLEREKWVRQEGLHIQGSSNSTRERMLKGKKQLIPGLRA